MNAFVRSFTLVVLMSCALPMVSAATSQSFTGNFVNDATTGNYNFTLLQAAAVTLRTYSYAGGTNAAGAPIPAGGFDPTLSLYDNQGNFITSNENGGCGNVPADPVTQFCWDSFLSVTLPAGTYTFVITQSKNLPNGPTLQSGFAAGSQVGFTTPPGATSTGFWDLFPSKRSSFYAVDVVSTALSVAPPSVTPPPVTSIPLQSLSFTSSGNLGGFVAGGTISGLFGVQGGLPPYMWSSAGLPAGLSLDGATGAYSGTAGNPGVYNFTVSATDSQSPPAAASLNVTYSVLGITTSALPNGSTTAPYSATLAATGGTASYSFSATGLPAGLSMSGSGVIAGTPRTAGTYTVVAQVSSGGLSTSSTFTLDVAGASGLPLTVSSATLPPATVSTAYPAVSGLQTSGGSPPYTWSVFGGVLPSGVSLSSSGELQGTPMLAGNYGFTAQVTDALGAKATGHFILTVGASSLAFALGTFPNGVVGATYPLQILTTLPSGGQTPYSLVVTGGSLPDGLILTGQEISGLPTVAGAFSFTVSVTDANGKVATSTSSILILPAQTTLILSQTSIPFTLTAGSSGVPTPASVTVRSSVVTIPLSYSFSVSPVAAWLDVTGGNTTPGALSIALDPTAPSLAASATPYSTVIAVTCLAPSPCAGSVQSINVALIVSAPPPQLILSNSILSFNGFTSSPKAASQPLSLQNAGGGTIDVNSVTTGASWATVSGTPTQLTAGPGVPITVTANPAGLSPGYFTTTLTVNSSAGSDSIPITLLVAPGILMSLSPAGAQFSAPAGSSPGIPGGSFNVSVLGTGTLSWTASLGSGTNWITLNTVSGTSSAASASSVGYSLNANVISSLAQGAYYATITVTGSGVVDSQQQFQVVLNVTPATTQVSPVLSAAGLLFTSTAGATTGPQSIQVYSGSASATTPYQASASTTDGGSWLIVSPATGAATLAAPGQSTISVNATGLSPGVYSGGVNYAFSSDAVRTVNVTLLVIKTGATGSVRNTPSVSSPGCTPSKLIGTQTGLFGNFAQPAGWPTPLTVTLVDDCGSPVNGASMTTTFSNGDPPMALSPRDASSGIYIGTWTPRNPAPQVTVKSTAVNTPFAPAVAQVVGQVRTNSAPILTPNGSLDVFNPVLGAALAPGQAIQLYGYNLSTKTTTAPSPLPNNLSGTSVLIGGVQAPLYYVSPSQIDAQIPSQLTPGIQYQILVVAGGGVSTPVPIQLVDGDSGTANIDGQVLAQHAADYSLITPDAPVVPGEYVVLYLSGLGATTNPVADGTPASSDPLSTPLITPTLTLDGAPVPIAFVGLTPSAVGLYQINFQIPANAANGNRVLLINQNGIPGNQVILPIQQ